MLCALYRDTDSLLCSECIDGYSESVNSAQCVKCEKSVYLNFLFLPFAMALVLSAFILLTNTEKDVIHKQSKKSKKGDKAKDVNDDLSDEEMTGRSVSTLSRKSTLSELMLANAKSDKTKLMLASLAKIAIYYEQVKWCDMV